MLSTAVSDTLLPYALDTSAEGQRMRSQVEADIDSRVADYRFMPEGDMRSVPDISKYLTFLSYVWRRFRAAHRGRLPPPVAGTPVISNRPVRPTSAAPFRPPRTFGTRSSGPKIRVCRRRRRKSLAWYVANEVNYLLTVKNNPNEAKKKYGLLAKIDTKFSKVYENIGDQFHDYGIKTKNNELTQRGRRRVADCPSNMPDADRRGLAKKLAAHYTTVGQSQSEAAEKPGGYKLLGDAIASFSRALEYDRDNKAIENVLKKTQNRKVEVDQQFEQQSRIIDSAEQVMKQAEESQRNKDYGNAIIVYNNALSLFGSVTEQFTELHDAAAERQSQIKSSIGDIKNLRLTEADDAIAKGDEAVDGKRFDEAMELYKFRPEDRQRYHRRAPRRSTARRRDEAIKHAEQKVIEAQNAKDREEAL